MQNVNVNLRAVEESAAYYSTCGQVNGVNEVVWAIKALQLTDLTTLAGDDTPSNVRRLCIRAAFPFTDHELRYLDKDVKSKIHTSAVCVYPSRVHDAHEALRSIEGGDKIEIAAGIVPSLQILWICFFFHLIIFGFFFLVFFLIFKFLCQIFFSFRIFI